MTIELFRKKLSESLEETQWFNKMCFAYYDAIQDYAYYKKIGQLDSIDIYESFAIKFEIENAIIELFNDKIYVDRSYKIDFDEMLKNINTLELTFKSNECPDTIYNVNYDLSRFQNVMLSIA